MTHIQLSITKDFTLVSLIVFLRNRRVDQIFGLSAWISSRLIYMRLWQRFAVTFYEYLLYAIIVMLR